MSNLETINAMLIDQKIPQKDREKMLYEEARRQMTRLLANKSIKKLK